jgi:hypothetical protein
MNHFVRYFSYLRSGSIFIPLKKAVTDQPLIQVCDQFGLAIHNKESDEPLKILEQEINRLLLHDFDRLISILYRVDVSEHKLKQLLKERPGEDAAKLIALLLVERQVQKIKAREGFASSKDDIDGEERW